MKTIYRVTYKDDFNNTHVIFLSDWCAILYLIDKFEEENVKVDRAKK